MRFVLPGYAVFTSFLVSGLLIFTEYMTYSNNAVWHGNVTPVNITHNSDGIAVLEFLYSDNKHGGTTNTEPIIRFSQNNLPYLWCDVSRTGAGTCFPPPPQKIKAEK